MAMTSSTASGTVPNLDTAQMIEVDRAMIEDYKIELIQMMENAGRNLAHLARQRFLSGDPRGKRIAVLVGSGGNGGGALVAARRLHNWGADVQIFLGQPPARMAAVPRHQLDILQRMRIVGADTPMMPNSVDKFAVILDGLLGYGLKGAPYGVIAELIRWANGQAAPILSLDAPSGVDTTTGTVYDPAIKAAATMTLALPKTGLRRGDAEIQVGELYLADISVPPALYAGPTLGLQVGPVFARDDIVRLR